MRLHLENFETVSFLCVSGAMGSEEARILVAGIRKLARMQKAHVLIDLTRAMIDEPAAEILAQVPLAEFFPVKPIWIGLIPNICEFEDFESAMKKLKLREFREIGHKLDLEVVKEGLKRLLEARERIVCELAVTGLPTEDLQRQYEIRNRNLRSAQMELINRVLDPVFSDLPQEPRAPMEKVLEIFQTLGRPSAKPSSASQIPSPASSTNPYTVSELPGLIRSLHAEVEDLRSLAKVDFLNGKSDRLVSLVIESATLRQRIGEIQAVWLQRLAGDADVTQSDFENGYSILLEQFKVAKEANHVE